MSGPLEGLNIHVIDLSRLAPGPFCTMMLGDLGADVIRVEQPVEIQEDADLNEERRRAAFNALNRNKRSIALDLKRPECQEALRRLCADADVFVEGFRPGVVKRLGCDYDTLKQINPRLVYCSISGYGQDGPYRDLVGHDINYISIGGALGVIGPEGGAPSIPYNIIADFAAGGMQAAVGILAALAARQSTGRGQYVDVSMTDGVAYLVAAMASEFFKTNAVPERSAMMLNGGVPYYNVYECADGKYISIGCIESRFWEDLCRALGHEDFIPHQHDSERYAEIAGEFKKIFKTRARDEWWDYLRKSGDIAVGKVYSLDEALDDPQLKHRQMIEQIGDAQGEPVSQVGIGLKFSDTQGAIRRLGPLTGEHTEEILRELGYDDGRIAAISN